MEVDLTDPLEDPRNPSGIPFGEPRGPFFLTPRRLRDDLERQDVLADRFTTHGLCVRSRDRFHIFVS